MGLLACRSRIKEIVATAAGKVLMQIESVLVPCNAIREARHNLVVHHKCDLFFLLTCENSPKRFAYAVAATCDGLSASENATGMGRDATEKGRNA